MNSETKINLTEIRIQDVGATCIMLVSKFSRVIKAKHGVTIQLRDPNVLNKVASYARASKSAELKTIYQQIEDEIRRYVFGVDSASASKIVLKPRSTVTKSKSKAKDGKNGFRRM